MLLLAVRCCWRRLTCYQIELVVFSIHSNSTGEWILCDARQVSGPLRFCPLVRCLFDLIICVRDWWERPSFDLSNLKTSWIIPRPSQDIKYYHICRRTVELFWPEKSFLEVFCFFKFSQDKSAKYLWLTVKSYIWSHTRMEFSKSRVGSLIFPPIALLAKT